MYRWKDTIGDVAERKENWNLWQAPAGASARYRQSHGLGFFEYFQLAEDIGAAPLPVVNAGTCCQARRGPAVPLSQLDPYVQDALDLVEFANGAPTTTWGAKRGAMGHPEPFGLKYLAVGNEQWDEVYFERYAVFYDERARELILQVVNPSGRDVETAVGLSGLARVAPRARLTVLMGRPADENSLDAPESRESGG